MTPKNAEEIVRERYPNAEIQHHAAVHQMGQKTPIQPESWAVYAAGGLGQRCLGTGPTAAAAWTAASTSVLEGVRHPKGLRIKRETLVDAGRLESGAVPVEEIDAALARGEQVIVVEMDGSESQLERGEDGKYSTSPRVT